jgi:2-polyprenyl-3-methyl-5-hydroxy-6-metoxy-1,4-benzoquinol methylase
MKRSGVIITTSWDDGSIYDLKLAGLLKKYDIPATFYVPVKNEERKVLKPNQLRQISKSFDIGAHTLNHKDLTTLSHTEVKEEVVEGKKQLEDVIGREIKCFCYPFGKVNQYIKQLVGILGFEYARTVSLFGMSVGDRLMAPTTVHAYKHNPLLYVQQGLGKKLFYSLVLNNKLTFDWEELAKRSLDVCLKVGNVFHLWGHSWEIEENNEWEKLERLFKYIKGNTKKEWRMSNGGAINRFRRDKEEYYSSVVPSKYNEVHNVSYFVSEVKFISGLTNDYDKKGKKVLEVGCGTGRISTIFKNAYYLGIDYSKSLIDFAKRHHSEENKRFINVDFSQMESLHLGKQDLILIWGMFEDENRPLPKLDLLKPLIKKNTRIIYTLFNYQNLIFRVIQYLRVEVMGRPFPYICFTPSFIREYLKNNLDKSKYKSDVLTYGLIPPLIPPVNKLIPGVRGGGYGLNIVVVLDKK